MFLAAFFSTLVIVGGDINAQALASFDQELSQIISRVSPAVVTVEARPTENKTPLFPGLSSYGTQPINAVVGSGLLLDSMGNILTIFSLIEGYQDFLVKIDGRAIKAKLVGIDQQYNLAVLKIPGIYNRYLEVSSFPPFIGRLAITYGRAVNNTGYPSLGIIAGRRPDGRYLISGSIAPGVLGGGVFDLTGKLIGIISSGAITSGDVSGRGAGGIVLLPVSAAMTAANRIICCGNKNAGYLGIETSAIELVSDRGDIIGEAVAISYIAPASPAAKAGLRVGDIITHFGDREISTDNELHQMVSGTGSGKTVALDLIRSHNKTTIDIVLSSIPSKSNYSGYHGLLPGSSQEEISVYQLQRKVDMMRRDLERLENDLRMILKRTASSP